MRVLVPALLLANLVVVVSALPARAAGPAIGCASLANLRLLMKQSGGDATAAAAVLGNDKADHLGCVVLARDAVTALAEHVALNGRAYDCVTLRTTSVCHWTVAGTVAPAEPARAGRKSTVDKPSSDKAKASPKPGNT
ncbi:hypothetical protein G3T14_16635 [Methylobacterium sp. BTF04]|uniref:hypothetical protein n=1 Tax=Methylobacterium sp. BTF04 TaxID=2708300 RepID=UPI0013CFB23C|nr:hypothetical protein [Methylobacterium sp. BTF04]NEU13747.1 hypothetical protein [Methylobacterium sp. BTF04]